MSLAEYVQKVLDLHPEFSYEEVEELCLEYLAQFNKKTKEESKFRSLRKYLIREFGVSFEEEQEDQSDFSSFSPKNTESLTPLQSIPKQYFQGKQDKKDYILKFTGFSKQLGKTILFENADLKIKFGEKIALIGKNGAGKSTLLKMLIGKESLEQGILEIPKEVKIWYLSQDLFRESRDRLVKDEMLTTFPEITKASQRLDEIEVLINQNSENSFSLLEEQEALMQFMVQNDGFQKYGMQREILKYFGFTKEQMDFKVSQLSWGEQTKLQIAKFLLQEVDFLILDEPTNHLDLEGILFLQRFCELWQKTLLCISHDRKFLNSAFEKVIEISNKKLTEYQGNYDDFLEQKEKNHEIQMKNYVAQQKYLQQQEKFIERFRYKASKASQVQSRIKMLDKMEKIEEPENAVMTRKIDFQLKQRLPYLIMEIDELVVGYAWKPLIMLPKKIEITKEMRIWIIGKNGVGKTTLIKTLLWEISQISGTFSLHKDLKIWSYSQALDELDYDNTILKEVVWPWISIKDARYFLGSLLIDNEKMEQKIGSLSWGEKAKVALTKMLLQKPHVIVLDEPTNHLDLGAKESIKMMLQNFDGVSLIVSHDRDFLEGTSNLLWMVADEKLEIYHDLERGFEDFEKKCLGQL